MSQNQTNSTMAAVDDGSGKRKRVSSKKKLRVNEKVEVRSMEIYTLGSWNSGTVIHCWRQNRCIRYDNILEDDEKTYCEQVVRVPAALDGESIGSSHSFERGIIRPIPPMIEIRECDLSFGVCVDANYEEAWWEGVIFDHENGMEQRSIFFPDLGDEIEMRIEQLRITQDWDEVSESWRQRRKWMFLELIEEIARESYIPVSIKQIYYDVRERDDFLDRIKDWTCNIKDLWREPITEIINHYTDLTIAEILHVLDLPRSLLEKPQEQESAENEPAANVQANIPIVADSNIVAEQESDELEPTANVESNVEVDEANIAVAADSNMTFPENETLVQEEHVPPVQEVMPEVEKETSDRREGRRARSSDICWRPVELPEAHYSPDVIQQYVSESKSTRDLMKDNVRRHIAHLGWTVDSTQDKHIPGRLRYRYKSPVADAQHQVVVNSLLKVCKYLQKQSSMHTQDDQSNVSHLPPDQPQESQEQDACLVTVAPSPVKDLVVEPELCPEAVVKYYFNVIQNRWEDKKKWRLKAMKHLLAEGWVLEYPNKKRRGAWYKSPQNHCLKKLEDACGVYLKESIPIWTVAGMRTLNVSAITGEGVDSDDIVECMTQLLEKDPEFNVRDALPASKSTENSRHQHMMTSNATPSKDQENGSPTRVQQPSEMVQKVPDPPVAEGRITQNVISWLIEKNKVVTRSKVYYQGNRGRDPPVAEGRITRDGIKCSCCHNIYGLNGFATHASGSSDCSPSGNIFLKDGKSLLDCQREFMYDDRTSETIGKPSTDFREEQNDDFCSICQFCGDLILCDNCPSSFHKECLGLKDIPDGDWFCPLCHCMICRKSTEDGRFLTCSQCELKYHVGCLRNGTDQSKRYLHLEQWFCRKECEQIYAGLHKLLGKPVSVGGGDNLTWTLLKYVNPESSDVGNTANDFSAESYSKLSVAASVMHECFEPLESPFSRRDITEDVIFSRSSNLPRANFQGFYTVLLERNEELISVANIRVYGEKVAEVPLVGTRVQYRFLGMCRTLMHELEKVLMDLGVKRLVLPAIPDMLKTWTKSFGFVKMTSSERTQFFDHVFLEFPETIMCHKFLTRSPPPDSDLTSGL